MNALKSQQIRHLRGLGHKLKPVVMVGQHGLSDNVLAEVEIALDAHELVKIKVSVGDRDERDDVINRITESTDAHKIQRIGNMALIYRHNKKNPKIVLPRPID